MAGGADDAAAGPVAMTPLPAAPSAVAEESELLLLRALQEEEEVEGEVLSEAGDNGNGDHSLLQLLCHHDEDDVQIESESAACSRDDGVLRKASALEYQQTGCPSSGLQEKELVSSHTHQPTPSTTNETPRRRNRKRPKQEMDALRVEEKELADKLTQLQEQLEQQNVLVASSREGSLVVKIAINKENAGSIAVLPGHSGTGHSPSTLLPSSAGIWQSLAWFQREDVRAAITENTRLQTLFQYQLELLSRLDAMYHQFSSVTLSALQQELGGFFGGDGAELTKHARVDPFDEDFAIFASLGHDFDAQYLKTDSIFESAGLANVDGRVRQEMLPKRGANDIFFLESLHSKTILHDLHAHDAMTWSVITSEDLHAHHGTYEIRELTEDFVCRKIVNKIQLPLGENTLTRRTALKRYIEADRVVVVWDAVLEVAGSVSMRLRERGWKILRHPHVIPAEHSGSEPITVEQWCVRITPELMTTYSEEDIATGSLTNAIVAAYRRHLKLMHHLDRNVFAAQFKKALDTLASRLNS